MIKGHSYYRKAHSPPDALFGIFMNTYRYRNHVESDYVPFLLAYFHSLPKHTTGPGRISVKKV